MQRTTTSIRINDTQVRHRTRIEGKHESEPGTYEARLAQYHLLQQIAENPGLLSCGHAPFEKLSMFHDNRQWVVETEAVVDESESGDVGP